MHKQKEVCIKGTQGSTNGQYIVPSKKREQTRDNKTEMQRKFKQVFIYRKNLIVRKKMIEIKVKVYNYVSKYLDKQELGEVLLTIWDGSEFE